MDGFPTIAILTINVSTCSSHGVQEWLARYNTLLEGISAQCASTFCFLIDYEELVGGGSSLNNQVEGTSTFYWFGHVSETSLHVLISTCYA